MIFLFPYEKLGGFGKNVYLCNEIKNQHRQ